MINFNFFVENTVVRPRVFIDKTNYETKLSPPPPPSQPK